MRKTYKAALFLFAQICLCAAISLHALAQDSAEDNKRRLLQFAANNRDFDTRIEAKAKEYFNLQIKDCDMVEQAVRQLPTPYSFLKFPDSDSQSFPTPDSGVWAEHVKIKACEKIWQINLLVVARSSISPLIFPLLPGNTLADPASQRNAERMGAISIKKSDTSCSDDAFPTYTRQLGYRRVDGTLGKDDAGNGWFEEWTFKFCQKNIPVQMAFTPDGSGGFDIKSRIVGNEPPKVPDAKPTPPAEAKPKT